MINAPCDFGLGSVDITSTNLAEPADARRCVAPARAAGRTHVVGRTISPRPARWRVFLGASLAAAALLLGFTPPAQAGHGVTYVSTAGKSQHDKDFDNTLGNLAHAQRFTTGSDTAGYDLTSIEVNLRRAPVGGTLMVTINPNSSGSEEVPASGALCTLVSPATVGTGLQKFSVDSNGCHLSAATGYWVYMKFSDGSTRPKLSNTEDRGEDMGEFSGWDIKNNRWQATGGGTWQTHGTRFRMKVNGPNSPPTASASTVSTEDNKTLTFTVADFGFSDADTGDSLEGVKITSVPAQGTLSLEGTDIANASDANPVGVTAEQLADGDLKYSPPIDTTFSVTFDFKVFDGADDSASAAEMSINVTDVMDNAKLSALTISAGTLNFDADTLNYTVTVANDVTGVTVRPTADDNDATVTVNGTDVASGSASGEIPLTEGGDTVIQVVVTAEDDTTTATYAFTVTRAASSNANLLALTISAGTLNFDAATTGYTVNVAYSVTDVTVTPTAAHGSATVTVNGRAVTSGRASDKISLTEDKPTDIAVEVTAQDGTNKTYSITVSRAATALARFRRLNNEILSKHALTIADAANRAIGARMDEACGEKAAAYTLGGGSTLYDTLHSTARAIEDGTLTLDGVLAGSSFRLPLGAANDDPVGGFRGPVVWGRGDRQTLESADPAFAWDGTVLTGQLGIDGCLGEDLVTGLALSRSIGEFDYTDGTGPAPVSGGYQSRMTSVHPHLGWSFTRGLGLWATLGYGWGEIEIDDERAGRQMSDTSLTTAAAGASGPVMSDGSLIAGGTTRVIVKGEASVARVEVDGDGDLIEKQTVDANRLRLALEGSHERALASGGSLIPSLELGLRHDGGDGITGGGIEIGVGLRYRDPATGLTIEGNGRALTGQGGDYREWGVGGSLRLDPGADGRGLLLSLAPAWGDAASGVDRLWDQDVAALAANDGAANNNIPQMRLDSELGYGLSAFGGHGLLVPYGGFSLADEGSQRYRIGSRFEIGPALGLSLEGERREPATDAAADHGIMLRMQALW